MTVVMNSGIFSCESTMQILDYFLRLCKYGFIYMFVSLIICVVVAFT